MAAKRKRIRIPCVQPLHHETYLEAMYRQKHLADVWRRIDNAKPSVDDGPPRSMVKPHSNLKKLLVEGQRLAFIEKDNKHLLREILNVMKGPGSVDHFHKFKLEDTSARKIDEKRRYINRINRENKKLLWRIINSRTVYDHIDMELEYQRKIRSNRGREYVFQMWNEQTDRRMKYVLTGKLPITHSEQFDPETRRAKLEETHRRCQLPRLSEEYLFYARPAPPCCQSPPGVKPVDHRRCLISVPTLPPVVVGRPSPSFKSAEQGDGPRLKENKAMKLRMEATKKRMNAFSCWHSATSVRHKGEHGRNKNANRSNSPDTALSSPRRQSTDDMCESIAVHPPILSKTSSVEASGKFSVEIPKKDEETNKPLPEQNRARFLPSLPARKGDKSLSKGTRAKNTSNSASSYKRKPIRPTISTKMIGGHESSQQLAVNQSHSREYDNSGLNDTSPQLTVEGSVNGDYDSNISERSSSTTSWGEYHVGSETDVADTPEIASNTPEIATFSPSSENLPYANVNRKFAQGKIHTAESTTTSWSSGNKGYRHIPARSKSGDDSKVFLNKPADEISHSISDWLDPQQTPTAFMKRSWEKDFVTDLVSVERPVSAPPRTEQRSRSLKLLSKAFDSLELHPRRSFRGSPPAESAQSSQLLLPVIMGSRRPHSEKVYRRTHSIDHDLKQMIMSFEEDMLHTRISPRDGNNSAKPDTGRSSSLESDSLPLNTPFAATRIESLHDDDEVKQKGARTFLFGKASKQIPARTDKIKSLNSNNPGSDDTPRASVARSQLQSLNESSAVHATVVLKQLFKNKQENAVDNDEGGFIFSSDED